MKQRQILVVGGGAAGMMAALFSAQAGAHVTLIERNEKLGKKVYITGKGRCNVTNNADMEQFMRSILRNPRFLFASFACLDNEGLMRMLEQLRVPLKVERGGRVFPVSDKASDIISAFRRELERLNVEIRLNARVRSLIVEGGKCAGVTLMDGGALRADAVVLATGGLSYPSTGSTGDGIAMAAQTGHDIVDPVPALVPIETRESWPGMLSGLSLKNVTLSAWQLRGKKEKRIFSEMGEMLFTHFGISGPLALSLSSVLPQSREETRIAIDLKPALDAQTLDARIVRDLREAPNKRLISIMDGLVPHSLGEQLLRLARLSPQIPANSVTAEQRAALGQLLKAVPLTPKSTRGFEEAIITRGGVSAKCVNPSTLESKCLPDLYFAGELLDVDAVTGGFNLQIAFSTGALAGLSAAKGDEEA